MQGIADSDPARTIPEHIFATNGDYCLYYPSNFFRNARSFEN